MPDLNPFEFAALLAEKTIEIEHETHHALEEAARLVEAEAKAEIGTYQPEAGPFEKWRELQDATKQDRVDQGYPENEPLLRSGALRDSIEHVVDGHTAYVGSNSPIAEYQELGTDRIPARSFLGGSAFRKSPEIAQLVGRYFVSALTGEQVPRGSLPIPSPE